MGCSRALAVRYAEVVVSAEYLRERLLVSFKLLHGGSAHAVPLRVAESAQRFPAGDRGCRGRYATIGPPRGAAPWGRGEEYVAAWAGGLRCSPGSTLVFMSEGSLPFDDEVADHQVIFRAGQVEAVVVPLEEYRALKALEQREAELYWVAHQDRYPSAPGDEVPDGKVYDSMEALVADLGTGE